ncbi:MAG: TIGR00341 family protein [Methylomonas lenta]|nr:TIGR00341 family protein [Methylomonas lenta]
MAIIETCWLIHKPEQKHLVPHALDCAEHLGATLEAVELERFVAETPRYLAQTPHVIALLESSDLGTLLQMAYQHDFSVGLLPVHPKSKVCRLYQIPTKMEDAMPIALDSEKGKQLDLLLCNGEVVSWLVTFGDVPLIELRHMADNQALIWQRLKAMPADLMAVLRLKPKTVLITTAKGHKIKTAIVGALVIENDIESLAEHFANETVVNSNGKLSAILVAPSSIMDYLSFFLTVLSPNPRLSRSIGYIETTSLSLENNEEIHYYIDGQSRNTSQLKFNIIPKAVTVKVGHKFLVAPVTTDASKEIIKTKTLPQSEERLTTLKQHLPLFSIAQEEDFKETFVLLRDYACFSMPFVLLMMLSTMLATLGLFLNSTPVVIGAMILAPLMGPLVSMSMGILRNDNKLLMAALQVLALGTGLTLLVAAVTTFLLPYEQATNEILSRLQPNLLDLGVAVVSGIAAAYAHARESIQKSLPGVAVAVALVPPVCVMGVGIGWFDWNIISGAGLLFLTNLVGITLAGTLTFLCLGFAPVIKVNRGLGFSVLLTILISIPLYKALENTVVYQRMEKSISTKTYEVNGKTLLLTDVSAAPDGDKIKILGQLHSSELILADDITGLRDIIGEQLDKSIVLDVSLRLVQ